MDSCNELFAFFDNSPKRKKFLDKVIDSLSAETKKHRLKDLCKTRWVERHSIFETLYELYEYIVIALNEICHLSNEKSIYPDNECWNWDSETRTKANGLHHTFTNNEYIVSFICAKELLEPMRPLVSSLQGELMEIYLGFKTIDQVIESYQLIRDDIDSWFNRMYAKVLRLVENIGS